MHQAVSTIQQRSTKHFFPEFHSKTLRKHNSLPNSLKNPNIRQEIAQTTSKVLEFLKNFQYKKDSEDKENLVSEPKFGGLSPIRFKEASLITEYDCSLAEIIPNYREDPSFLSDQMETEPVRSPEAPKKRDVGNFLKRSMKYGLKMRREKGASPRKFFGKKRAEKCEDPEILNDHCRLLHVGQKHLILREEKSNSACNHEVFKAASTSTECYPKLIAVNLQQLAQIRKMKIYTYCNLGKN